MVYAASRKWKEANPERLAAYTEAYRADNANRNRMRAAATAWKRANPARFSELDQRRRARIKEAFVADVSVDDLTGETGNLCGICGDPIEEPPHIDHIRPLSRGGAHEPASCQLAHPACNYRKWAKTEPATT